MSILLPLFVQHPLPPFAALNPNSMILLLKHLGVAFYGHSSSLLASTYHPHPPSRVDRTGVAKKHRAAHLD